MNFIENVRIDEANGESIYNLVSRSTSNLKLSEQSTETPPTSTPESPSAMLRPLSEFNMMATNVFNKVTYVPRAITSAIGDTFRSRSGSKLFDESATSPGSLKWKPKSGNVHPVTGQAITLDAEIEAFRQKVMNMRSVDDLSVKEIPILFADYKNLLMTFHYEPHR